MINVQFVFKELLIVQNGIGAVNFAFHLVHTWQDIVILPVHHMQKLEEECQRINLPYGMDGVMYVLGKHVNQYQTFKSYIKCNGTHNFEPHVRVMMSECSV